MEDQFTESILQAIQLTISGNNPQTGETEKFLMENNNGNQTFFVSLLKICVNSAHSESIRMSVVLIIKRHIMANWLSFTPEIKALFKDNIIDLICNSKSIKTAELTGDCFYQLLHQEHFPEKWPEIENSIYERLISNQSNFDNLYFLTLAYSKISKVREHLINKNRKEITVSVSKFLPVLESIAISEMPSLQQRSIFLKLISKIFFKSFRYDFDEYIRNHENCNRWFNIFFAILKEYKSLPDAAKWITRMLISVFRKNGNPKVDSDNFSFATFWQETWGYKILEVMLEILYSYDRDIDSLSIVNNISRSFFHISRNPYYTSKYAPIVFKLFSDRLFNLIVYSPSQVEDHIDNPIEFFKSADEYYHENSLRNAVITIITSFTEQGLLTEEILGFTHKVIVEKGAIQVTSSKYDKGAMEKEAAYHIIEKLTRKIQTFKDADKIVINMLQSFVIPDLSSPNDILRTRCCSLLKELLKEQEEDGDYAQLYQAITEKLCLLLQDSYFPVRGIAALGLTILLKQASVAQFIKPHINDLLTIYIKLIDECDNEMLINSLTEVCESFGDDLGPNALKLLENLARVVIRLYNKQNEENKNVTDDEIEQNGFALISAFSSMGQILKSKYDSSLQDSFVNIIFQMLQILLKQVDFEMYEEILSLINIILSKSERGKIPLQMWQFYEFICYSLNEDLIIPQNPQNIYLSYLNERSSFKDLCVQTVNVLRNFVYKGFDAIIQGHDQNNIPYLSLLLTTMEYLKNITPTIIDETQRYSIYFFKANLLLELRSQPEIIKSNDCIRSILTESLSFIGETNSGFVSLNTFLHNLGICFSVDPITSYNFVISMNMTNDFLKNWIDRHKDAATFRVRKASFLGLLSLLQNYTHFSGIFTEAKIDIKQFILLMLKEVARLSTQYEYEIEQFDGEDDGLFDSEDEDDEEDTPKAPVSIFDETIPEFEKRIAKINNHSAFEIELLISYDHEITEDSFEHLNHALLFKDYIEIINVNYPGIFNELYAQLDTETQKIVKESFEAKSEN
jgi:hypothetical protein